MTALQVHKVTSLPVASALQPSTIYIVAVGADSYELHISNLAGTATRSLSAGDFLPLTGGTISGAVSIDDGTNPVIKFLPANFPQIRFEYSGELSSSVITTINAIILRKAASDTSSYNDFQLYNDHALFLKGVITNEPTTEDSSIKSLTTKDYVDGKFPSVMARGNDTTTNIYSTTWAEIPAIGAGIDVAHDDFKVSGNGIMVGFDGWVEATTQLHIYSAGQRSALQIKLANGSYSSHISSTGYIRAVTGHYESSLMVTDRIEVVEGDIITVQGQRESTNTTAITMISSNLILKRL